MLYNDLTRILVLFFVVRAYVTGVSGVTVTTLVGGSKGYADGIGSAASFNNPNGIAMNALGTIVLVADTDSHVIRRIDVSSRSVTTLAGSSSNGGADGVGSLAEFKRPYGIAMDALGSSALVADTMNCIVRIIDISARSVATLAGTVNQCGAGADGYGSVADFNEPRGIAVSADGLIAVVVSGWRVIV